MLNNTFQKLQEVQRALAKKVIIEDVFHKPIRTVAGIDLAFIEETAVVACVIVDYGSLGLLSNKLSLTDLTFQYVSTFLCYREGPPIMHLITSLDSRPDIFLLNAHGIAHPLLSGCASYVGVLANVPTIGVASQRLCGRCDYEPEIKGEHVPLYFSGQTVGWVLKSREDCRPIIVSPGHRVSLQSSVNVVLHCIKDHKLPEPIYLAHRLANEERKKRWSELDYS